MFYFVRSICRGGRKLVVFCAMLAVVAFGITSVAYAAYNYTYHSAYVSSGDGGGDNTLYYRNYNDSCSGDGYGYTKSIYADSGGGWVATVETYNACGFSKAHLGPSDGYGVTYAQSKCRNTNGTTLYLICNTTRP